MLNRLRIKVEKIKHLAITSYIKHLADSANFKGVTTNKLYSSFKGSYFEMPNISYTKPLQASLIKDSDMKIDQTTYKEKEENQIGLTAGHASRPDKVLFGS